MNQIRKSKGFHIFAILVLCLSIFTGCGESDSFITNQGNNQSEVIKQSVTQKEQKTQKETKKKEQKTQKETKKQEQSSIKWNDIPDYQNKAYVILNENQPDFSNGDKKRTDAFETYSNLDSNGRCQTAYANICKELMPDTKREGIGQVKPTGWHTVKYDCVDGKYLYNRCHLIGYQLAGENANEKNLITGTRYLNTKGMLPFENMVADYVKETNNHVLYRVKPWFKGNDLLARGVEMEAWSVEDKGEGICFHVFVYNVQPGIAIDYATGESSDLGGSSETQTSRQKSTTKAATTKQTQKTEDIQSTSQSYIINENTNRFHRPSCRAVKQMKESNRKQYTGSRDSLLKQGYDACKICQP